MISSPLQYGSSFASLLTVQSQMNLSTGLGSLNIGQLLGQLSSVNLGFAGLGNSQCCGPAPRMPFGGRYGGGGYGHGNGSTNINIGGQYGGNTNINIGGCNKGATNINIGNGSGNVNINVGGGCKKPRRRCGPRRRGPHGNLRGCTQNLNLFLGAASFGGMNRISAGNRGDGGGADGGGGGCGGGPGGGGGDGCGRG